MSVSVDEREYPVAELDVQGAVSSEFRVASRGKIAKMLCGACPFVGYCGFLFSINYFRKKCLKVSPPGTHCG